MSPGNHHDEVRGAVHLARSEAGWDGPQLVLVRRLVDLVRVLVELGDAVLDVGSQSVESRTRDRVLDLGPALLEVDDERAGAAVGELAPFVARRREGHEAEDVLEHLVVEVLDGALAHDVHVLVVVDRLGRGRGRRAFGGGDAVELHRVPREVAADDRQRGLADVGGRFLAVLDGGEVEKGLDDDLPLLAGGSLEEESLVGGVEPEQALEDVEVLAQRFVVVREDETRLELLDLGALSRGLLITIGG